MITAESRFAELYEIARQAGWSIARLNPEILSPEDLAQEAVTWLLGHPERVDRSTDVDGNLYHQRLFYEVLRHLVPIVRNERSAQLGVQVDDVRYNLRTVRVLLPAHWTGEGAERTDSEIRAKGDAAEGGNWIAGVIDVGRALKAVVGKRDEQILFLRYAVGLSWPYVGQEMDLLGNTARMRGDRALEAMVDYLNGLDVTEHRWSPHTDGLGIRKIRTNAAMRHITSNEYSGDGIAR